MNIRLLLPALLTLAGGMAVGSIHNAQMRDVLPGVFTGLGGMLMILTLVLFAVGLWITCRLAMGLGGLLLPAGLATVLELANLGQTLSQDGNLSGWLFHEWLGLVVAPLLFVQLLLGCRGERS